MTHGCLWQNFDIEIPREKGCWIRKRPKLSATFVLANANSQHKAPRACYDGGPFKVNYYGQYGPQKIWVPLELDSVFGLRWLFYMIHFSMRVIHLKLSKTRTKQY